MTLRDPDLWLGRASIGPAGTVEAGSFGTWTITVQVGRYGIDDTGGLKVLVRTTCDISRFQVDDPAAEGFCTVSTNGQARLVARADSLAGERPWAPGLVIQVVDGSLAEGDLVTVVLGERSGGSPGCRMQTFPEQGFEFRVLLDNIATGRFERLPTSPCVDVVPGPAVALVAQLPSQARLNERVRLLLRAQDTWGNPTPSYTGSVRLSGAEGLPESCVFRAEDRGVRWVDGLSFSVVGLNRVEASDQTAGLRTQSNPVDIRAERPEYQLYWGDTQGQSGATVGTGGVEPFFRYARDVAGLDFVVHSGNDFQITREHWEETRQLNQRFHQPGQFVTFLSYEWSGNTPAGGDHNVIYRNDDGPLHRSSHWLIDDRSDEESDRYPVSELWATFRDRDDVMAIAHVGGRRADFGYHDPRLCPVIEICSVHGWFEWFAREALEKGLVVGFVGATDDHSGRPGASYPTARGALPVRGGLAGVYARGLSREGLWEALMARRCYATTGERMLLRVSADGHWMGERFRSAGGPAIEIEATGTAPLEAVDILRGTEVVHRHRFGPPGRRLRIVWSGARVESRARQTRWDGGLTLSDGRIVRAESWGFDPPHEGLTEVTARAVSWRSGTSGDEDGVTLELDAPDGAEVHFQAGPADFRFRPVDVGVDPLVFDFGGVEQRVEVHRLPDEPGPLSALVRFRDPAPRGGLNAYWVRAVQADSHRAWSSPLYVDIG